MHLRGVDSLRVVYFLSLFFFFLFSHQLPGPFSQLLGKFSAGKPGMDAPLRATPLSPNLRWEGEHSSTCASQFGPVLGDEPPVTIWDKYSRKPPPNEKWEKERAEPALDLNFQVSLSLRITFHFEFDWSSSYKLGRVLYLGMRPSLRTFWELQAGAAPSSFGVPIPFMFTGWTIPGMCKDQSPEEQIEKGEAGQ